MYYTYMNKNNLHTAHNALNSLQNNVSEYPEQSESKLINGVAGKTTGHVILIHNSSPNSELSYWNLLIKDMYE
jgi:hypothetical protein